MANNVQVQLSFIPGRLKKLREFANEHGWKASIGATKNAQAAMNIVNFILDLRHDPIYEKIITHERYNFLTLISNALYEYATRKGYVKKSNFHSKQI